MIFVKSIFLSDQEYHWIDHIQPIAHTAVMEMKFRCSNFMDTCLIQEMNEDGYKSKSSKLVCETKEFSFGDIALFKSKRSFNLTV